MSTDNGTGVYKYCDEHGLDILRNLELKFTPPNEFNDPFEFVPCVISSNSRRTLRQLVNNKSAKKEAYLAAKRDGSFKGNFRQYRERLSDDLTKVRNQLFEMVDNTLAEAPNRYLELSSRMVGVLCLSSRRDSILMWGHYCNKHRGLTIGFDPNSGHFSEKAGLFPVSYVSERVTFDERWKENSEQCRNFYHRIIFSKNDDWAYENESRIIRQLDKLKQVRLHDGRTGYFGSFPPEAIQAVTLGARCTKKFEDEVRAVLQDKKFAHVKLDRAKLHRSAFALEFEPA